MKRLRHLFGFVVLAALASCGNSSDREKEELVGSVHQALTNAALEIELVSAKCESRIANRARWFSGVSTQPCTNAHYGGPDAASTAWQGRTPNVKVMIFVHKCHRTRANDNYRVTPPVQRIAFVPIASM
jgi:hypothetical protein